MTKKRKKRRPTAFGGIKRLRCYGEVVERLLAGYPCDEVARYIQETEGEYLHATRRSLAEVLRRFAMKEIAPAEVVGRHLPAHLVRATRQFNNRLEELERLELVYEALLYRFTLAHAEERRAGKVNPDVDRQAKVLADMITKMHEIKMDLGLTGSRDLGTLTVSAERLAEIRERYGDAAARAFADPVQRAQVLGLLKRVMRLRARPDVEDLPQDPTDEPVDKPANKPVDRTMNRTVNRALDEPVEAAPAPAPIAPPRSCAAPDASPPARPPAWERAPIRPAAILPVYFGAGDEEDLL